MPLSEFGRATYSRVEPIMARWKAANVLPGQLEGVTWPEFPIRTAWSFKAGGAFLAYSEFGLWWRFSAQEVGFLPWGELVHDSECAALFAMMFDDGHKEAFRLAAELCAVIPAEPVSEAHELQILSNPLDLAARSAYLKWFEERGHARASWAVDSDNAPSTELGTYWPADVLRVKWMGGFWDSVELFPDGVLPRHSLWIARRVLSHPSSKFSRRVSIGRTDAIQGRFRDLGVSLVPVLLELPLLRELWVGGVDFSSRL